MTDGSWGEWRNMVLREIGRQNTHLERLEQCNTDTLVEIGRLKLIAGICGAATAGGVSLAVHIMTGG